MRSDIDDFDLYPPDAEEVTADAKQARLRAAVGAALLTWGIGLLVDRLVPVDIDTGMLGIGVGALAGWAQLRRYPWFAVGAILTGFGAGGIVEEVVGGAFGESLSSLIDAAGFAAVFVRYPTRSRWALIPAAFFVVFALGAFGVGLIGLLPDGLGRLLLPALLITAGGILLFRQSLPRNAVRVGLPAVGAAFVIIAASNVPEVGNISFGGDEQVIEADLPVLEGRTLVFTAINADVAIDSGSRASVEATVSRFGRPGPAPRFDVDVDEEADEVRVRLAPDRSEGFGFRRADYRLTIPERTPVRIETQSGDVSGSLAHGDVEIRTESGDVEIESDEELDLDLASQSHDIEVNGNDEGENYERAEEDAPRLKVVTDSGEIDIDDAA